MTSPGAEIQNKGIDRPDPIESKKKNFQSHTYQVSVNAAF